MTNRELKAMGEAMTKNSFAQLSFRIGRNLWAFDNPQETIDQVWKAYHFYISKLNRG
jgi:hypothetical protein